MLLPQDRRRLERQRILTRVLSFFSYGLGVFWLKYLLWYRISELKRVRRRFAEIVSQAKAPLIICPNHLTMIDSAIIIWALAPFRRIIVNPQYYPWNLPERKNFFNNIFLRFFCYLTRCIPVERRGPPEETRRVLDKIQKLLLCRESIMIFPEGHRSRNGRVDTENYAYGVGRILQEVPSAKVLCVYLRGEHQETYGSQPRWGDKFYLDMELIAPASEQKSLRGGRDISSQIIAKLVEMEHKYFAAAHDYWK